MRCVKKRRIWWCFGDFLLDKNDEICIIVSVRMRILSLSGDRVLCTKDELVIYKR